MRNCALAALFPTYSNFYQKCLSNRRQWILNHLDMKHPLSTRHSRPLKLQRPRRSMLAIHQVQSSLRHIHLYQFDTIITPMTPNLTTLISRQTRRTLSTINSRRTINTAQIRNQPRRRLHRPRLLNLRSNSFILTLTDHSCSPFHGAKSDVMRASFRLPSRRPTGFTTNTCISACRHCRCGGRARTA